MKLSALGAPLFAVRAPAHLLLITCFACSPDAAPHTPPPTPQSGGSDGSGGADGSGGGDGSGGAGGTVFAGGNGGSGDTGGNGGSGDTGGNGGSVPSDEGFTLLFRDDFDSLDLQRWQLMTHSWDSNLAVFSAESATIQDGELRISLLAAPEGTMSEGAPKQFLGAEVRSTDAITYGRVRARIKFASGSAVVSSLVTIYTPWPADNWNELDVESLGKNPSEVQFNAMVYTGMLPATSTPVSPTQDPLLFPLGFDSSADFHEYTIEWTPTEAKFFVDDVLARTWTSRIELMNLPQNILLTIWASNSAAWAGPVDATTVGAFAAYDWIEVYEYTE